MNQHRLHKQNKKKDFKDKIRYKKLITATVFPIYSVAMHATVATPCFFSDIVCVCVCQPQGEQDA